MNRTIFDKIGLPKPLAWAYLGILIFMMGDGIEQGWLSPYLIGRSLSLEQSAGLFTMYGVTIAISAWFSGVLAEAYGVKRTMFAGLVLYLLGTCGFVGLSLPGLHYPLMLATYALRGFGYPLFAYSFLVWIAYAAPKDGLGKAVGWFWFVFTGGLNVLGAYYSSWAIERIGNINTLWTSVFWALLGAFFALVMNKSQKRLAVAGGTREKMRELLKGITIMKQEPKVLLGGIVRVINTTAQFAFPVFLPMYMADYGFTTTEWLRIWGTIFTANIVFNLIFGFVGDKVGWRNTIIWFGGVGCGLYGMIGFAILTVFIAGLMVGRTPEFLGKKIEPTEMRWAVVLCLATPFAILVSSTIACMVPGLVDQLNNGGAHGFSEVLYTLTSAGGNNGSSFAGMNCNIPWINVLLGIEMLFARFLPIAGTLAIAGSLAGKGKVAEGAGTLSTTNAMFVFLLVFVVLLIGALSFFPALALGPVAEFFQMVA